MTPCSLASVLSQPTTISRRKRLFAREGTTMIRIPKHTTVEVGEQPLAICDCDEQRPDDELLASVPADGTGRDVVVIHRNGDVTNMYADGVFGVTDGDRRMAEQDEEPFCDECGDYVHGWLHPQ